MQADVIIVGAGAFGLNAAWHLRQRGLKPLVLDAASGPATQATRAAAGFVAQFSGIHHSEWGMVEWGMQRYGIEYYTALAARCDQDIGFCACGVVYIYETAVGWQRAQQAIAAARTYGTRLEILTRERATELVPQIRFDATAGMLFDPDAIRLRVGVALAALAKELSVLNVHLRYNTAVEELLVHQQQIMGVRTEKGEVHSARVLVAAGAWTRPLLAQVGVQLAADPVVVARYTTRPLPGINRQMPLLLFSDSPYRFWIREEQGGLLIGGGDPRPLPIDRLVDADAPPCSQALPLDHARRTREYVRQIESIMPLLKDAEINAVRAGLPCYTVDRLFAASAVPMVHGLYALAACNEAGITHGPALGRHLAECIVDGVTSLEGSRFDIARF